MTTQELLLEAAKEIMAVYKGEKRGASMPDMAHRLEAAAEWMGEPLDEAITRLESKLAADREKVRVLRESLDEIAESDPDESAGRLRDIANEALAGAGDSHHER